MNLVWGLVENINDPISAQRVQVRIYGYYDNLSKDELPWCQVLRSATDTLTFGYGKSSHELVPGSQVLCAWLDSNYQQPIVIGQVPRIDDCAEQTDLDKQVYKTKGGNEISIDDDVLYVKDKRGNIVQMDSEGVSIKTEKSSVPKSQGDLILNISGNVKLNVSQNSTVSISGNSNVNVDGNSDIKVSGKATIDANSLSMKNITGINQFCCLPNCLFTGAKHTAPSTD